MFLIVNGTKHDFDRQATEVHELGHTIGIAHSKRALRLRGTAACIARVGVAISRTAAHHRCRFVTARGKLGKARRCSKPVFVTARGVASWRLATKALPPGRYTIRVRPGGATRKVRIRRTR